MYETLKNQVASRKINQSGTQFSVTIGPSGAAKILFALRPRAIAPWDEPIREKLGYDKSGESFKKYLLDMRQILTELKPQCEKAGFKLEELPSMIGRNISTVPKLIDEYYWVTISKKFTLPEVKIFQKWARWS